jgi:hypothetical protein
MTAPCTMPLRYRQGAMTAKPSARRIPTSLVGILGAGIVAYALYHRTRWYREGNRLFYANGRPNRAGRAFGGFWVAVSGRGLGPDWMVSLETVGHKSGRRSSIPPCRCSGSGPRGSTT